MLQRCFGCMHEYEGDDGVCPHCGYRVGTTAEIPLHMQPGTVLGKRYVLGRVLGYGGFGVTYIAWDELLAQRVAIKEYLPSEFATRTTGENRVSVFSGNKAEQYADGLVKFVDEARRLAKFQSEDGIVRVLDTFEENNTAYIVMEYLNGETLTSYLSKVGRMPIEQAIQWIEPLVHSLEAIHKEGIIHRDIAPDNIFITNDKHIKLIDFGAARYATTSHSRSLTVIIKAGYSPEEQYRSRGEQGPHTDVYALAAVLYRMITGITPPDALERRAVYENKKKDLLKSPSKFCSLDKSTENAILNAMNIQAKDRTSTISAFWDELKSERPIRRRRSTIPILDLTRWPLWAKIGLPIIFTTGLAILVLLVTGKIGNKNLDNADFLISTDKTRVPSVINYSVSLAQEMLNDRQLASIISGRQQSDVIPADLVLTQSIPAGHVVEKGTSVELYISATPNIQVEENHAPNVMYYTEEEAVALFNKQGISPSIEYQYCDDVASGLVIWQSVMAGEQLQMGEAVTLAVSMGPDPAQNESINPEIDSSQPPTASENDGSENKPSHLKLNKNSLLLYVGDKITLNAQGGNGTYEWATNDSSIADVKDGLVTAKGQGQAVITVTCGNESITCQVIVHEYSLSLSQTVMTLEKGNSATLIASGAPSNTKISWASNNTSIVKVQDGHVSAVGAGNATISASFTYGGKEYTATCAVTVTEKVVCNISLSKSSLSLIQGNSETITVTVFPQNQGVTWSSDNNQVVTVNNGEITAVGAGTAHVTVQTTYEGKTYSDVCEVTVTSKPGSLTVSPKSIDLVVGEKRNISFTTIPNNQTVTWSSSNSSVATVNNGEITANAAGTSLITAQMTYNGKKYTDTCEVIVVAPQGSLSVSPDSLELEVGGTYELRYETYPDTDTVVTWSSSNSTVAEVINGRIRAKAEGSTTITAKMAYGGEIYSDTCEVTVTRAPYIKLDKADLSYDILVERYMPMVGGVDIKAETFPENQNIKWRSSNDSVVSVSAKSIQVFLTDDHSAILSIHSAGTATIYADMEYNGKTYTASCNITVKPPKITPNLTANSITLKPGETFELSPSMEQMSYRAEIVRTWSSSNPAVATINDSGTVTAVGPGTAVITATNSVDEFSESAQCTVTVEEIKQHVPETITIPVELSIGANNISSATANKGDTVKLSISVDTAGESGYHLFTLWIAKLESYSWKQLNAYYVDGSLVTTYTLDTSSLESGSYIYATSLFYSDEFETGKSIAGNSIYLEILP